MPDGRHLRELMDERVEHQKEMRKADDRFFAERDRRYAEVNVEREKALKIKETADETARVLARTIQDYKDEKANDLRSQIERERGQYATHADLTVITEKFEATVAPVVSYVAAQQGRSTGAADLRSLIFGAAGFVSAVVAVFYALAK